MEFLNSLEYGTVIFAVLVVSGFWMFGYHTGNRFRLSRLMMREPKEISKRIKQIQNQIAENKTEIEFLNKQEFKDKWKIDRLEAEIKIFKIRLEILEWTMNKENT